MPYLTPDEIPEGDDCRPLFIPSSTEWLAIVSGALTELTKTWNWEQFGSVTVDEAVERMQAMIEQYYADACGDCLLPDGEKIIRLGENFEFQELSGGEWVEPTGDYELPPIPVREEPTAEERKCLAAANATEVFKQLYESLTDSYNLDLDPALALTAWAGTWSTAALVALGFLSFSAGVILYGLWTILYQAMEFLTEDVWGEDFDSKMKCALLLAANDDAGVVTFDYQQFMDNLAFNTDLGDPSLGELRLYAQIHYMLSIVGSDGLNQAGATTSITEVDCGECAEGWCFEWDFTIDDGGWTAIDGLGTYESGVGWHSVMAGGTSPALFLRKNFPITNSLRDFEVTYTQADAINGFRRLFRESGGSYIAVSGLQGSTNGVDVQAAVLADTTTVDLTNMVYNWSADALPSSYLLSKVLVRGDFDPNPFGADNCAV